MSAFVLTVALVGMLAGLPVGGAASADPSQRNRLGAVSTAAAPVYRPGDAVALRGSVFKVQGVGARTAAIGGVGARFMVRLVTPTGEVRGPFGPFAAADAGARRGAFALSLPQSATAGIVGRAADGYRTTLGVELLDASYRDGSGTWRANRIPAGSVTVLAAPGDLVLENNFVSAVGWVKPGETYPFRVLVKNFEATPRTTAVVTIAAPDGATFTNAVAVAGSGTCSLIGSPASVTWNIGTVEAAGSGPTVKTCVVEGTADTTVQDPQIVWKNLSSTASLTYDGLVGTIDSTSHGPKVIPPSSQFDTARYGDRPFPVVPIDYLDRAHTVAHSGTALADKINSPAIPGSTFNLYQEMSYGQLFPNGTVPSAGIASANWTADWQGNRYTDNQFDFTEIQPSGTCHGATLSDTADTVPMSERITDGWYQLPGNTDYYGDDRYGSALIGNQAGVGAIFAIDDACGPTGKAVYDAAHIADPEIDYSDYDTDKDGIVDFFMMVFAGIGGHGASQTSVPPYDNIWPHSSSLEFTYTDSVTRQKGYVSDDQLHDLEGNPQCWLNTQYLVKATCASHGGTGNNTLPYYVAVGPYNVNPENAIDNASVISHEYGHSLGLPDFYSTGGRSTYGDWNLMATDKSQHMDVFSKQELGWIVPRVLPAGVSTATGWRDSKVNTERIDWVTPAGTPYTLTGPTVDNGEAYVAKLPARQIIDPDKVATQASATHVWWSLSGNDFGCTPTKGHNLDIFLPELKTVAPGTTVTLSMKHLWDIEWDFDYGFVLISDDGGVTYTSVPSANGYTTPGAVNPNAVGCQTDYGNGLTGSSGSYDPPAPTSTQDRVNGDYPDPVFLEDEFDISALVGGDAPVLRFSFSSDPAVARTNWFIDDVTITAGAQTIYETDFEGEGDPNDPRIFNGGCKSQTRTAPICTPGWLYVDAGADAPFDHAYYLEMRDRSGFDFEGRGENDRAAIAFAPGLLLVYTDEAHGYGNAGTDDPPAQSPLDSTPQPGNQNPNLNDAAFTEVVGKNTYSDAPPGRVDNYQDPRQVPANRWTFSFNCLAFNVQTMAGRANGPVDPPYDLTGNVQFTTGPGCVPFDYGYDPINVAPDLSISKSASQNPADTGTELTYSFTVSNVGQTAATGATLTDTLPAGTVLMDTTASQGTPCTGTTTVTCNLGTIDGGGSATVDITVGLTTNGDKTNTATIVGVGDTNAQNDTASVTTTVNGLNCTADLIGTAGNDTLTGTNASEVICGFRGDDTLTGGLGNDFLLAGSGNDDLDGGDGVDRLAPGTGNDVVEGGTGLGTANVGDTVTYFDIRSGDGVDVSLLTAAQQNTGPGGLDTIGGVESITGSRQDDSLRGNGGINYLTGGRGNDALFGEGGNDVLVGSQGDDALDGGLGIDTASYIAAPAGTVVDLSTTPGTAADGYGAEDTLTAVEAISGSNAGGDDITGSALRDFLYGQGNDDTLRGLGGNDYLVGGGGTDTLEGGEGSDVCRSGETVSDCESTGSRAAVLYPWNFPSGRAFLDALSRGSGD